MGAVRLALGVVLWGREGVGWKGEGRVWLGR